MENAPANCVLCGNKEKEPLITVDSWCIQRCVQCGLGVLDPRPSSDELAKLYNEDYCEDRFVEGGLTGTPEYTKRLSLETHRIKFFRSFKRSGKVLDIGCGYGYFLAACREKGYDIHGLDFSDWAAHHARDRIGIPLTIGPLDEVSFPENSFDVITMWHSLEHMSDPREAVSRANSWLKDDGLLVVDVPNYTGTDARNLKEEWNGWDPPYHFYHFTPQALTSFLGKFGFRVIRKKDYHSETIKASLKKYPLINLIARPISKFYSGHSFAVVTRLKKSAEDQDAES